MSEQQIATRNEKMPAVSAENTALIAMIERVCLDASADISKLEKMLDMQERILNRNAEQAFAADFAAMQSELPRIAKNGTIEIKDKQTGRVTQSTPFAKLEDINDGVRPTLQKYGFGVSFSIEQGNQLLTVTAKLLHRLGHSEKTSISLPIDNTGSKNAVQGSGSTVSYGKRYSMCALLNISTGDDIDGNELEPVVQPQAATPNPQKMAITDERLANAITKIKNKEYTVEALKSRFDLTPAQVSTLEAEINKAVSQ